MQTNNNCIVIFGASGDLTHRKLIPALYNLFKFGRLNQFSVLGVARTELNDDTFREKMREALLQTEETTPETLEEFCNHLYYQAVNTSDAADYAQSMKTPARFIDMSENPTKYSKNALVTVSVKWAEDGNELERIITQKWIALYPNGMEAWAEFRRTGFPKLFPINENSNDPSIDKNKQIRLVIFPKSEYANNAGAVNAATRLLGGPDSGGTRLWWDAR